MADDLDDVVLPRDRSRADARARFERSREPDPRTLAVPADATVHLHRQDEDRVTVDDFGPGSPTVAVMRESWRGAMRSLTDLGEQVRAITAERDDLAERLAQAALDRDRERADGNLAAQQARGWMDEAVRQAAYRDALFSLAVLYVPLDMRRGTALDPTWTPDAPAGPPSKPVAAQEPPAGGIGPTQAQRGAEGVACSRPHTMSMPPGRIDFPLRCPECGDLVTIWVGSTAVSARYVPGGPVPPTQWYLVGEGDPVNITADVDTVSGASQRREGEQ